MYYWREGEAEVSLPDTSNCSHHHRATSSCQNYLLHPPRWDWGGGWGHLVSQCSLEPSPRALTGALFAWETHDIWASRATPAARDCKSFSALALNYQRQIAQMHGCIRTNTHPKRLCAQTHTKRVCVCAHSLLHKHTWNLLKISDFRAEICPDGVCVCVGVWSCQLTFFVSTVASDL